jgi:hypothetical protein
MEKPPTLDERPIEAVVSIRMDLLEIFDPGLVNFAKTAGIKCNRDAVGKKIAQDISDERLAYFASDYDPTKDASIPR